MHRDKDGVALGIGDGAALVEAHEVVAAAGQDHAIASGAQIRAEASRHVEGVDFLRVAHARHPAAVVPAVAGVDDHRGPRPGRGGRQTQQREEQGEKVAGLFHGKARAPFGKGGRKASGFFSAAEHACVPQRLHAWRATVVVLGA